MTRLHGNADPNGFDITDTDALAPAALMLAANGAGIDDAVMKNDVTARSAMACGGAQIFREDVGETVGAMTLALGFKLQRTARRANHGIRDFTRQGRRSRKQTAPGNMEGCFDRVQNLQGHDEIWRRGRESNPSKRL